MNERFRRDGLDLRMVRLQPWKLWLLAAVGVTVALTLAVLLAGLFLILVPLFLVGGLIAKLLLSGNRAGPRRPLDEQPSVIEGRYEVVAVDRQPKHR